MTAGRPTPSELKDMLHYDVEAGALEWKERMPYMFSSGDRHAEHKCNNWNSRNAGRPAFCSLAKNGYLFGRIWRASFYAHRVAWAMHSGSWPEEDIDHINGCRTDNRIINLRAVTRAENLRNKAVQSNNTSGCTGVDWSDGQKKWRARVQDQDGTTVSLGSFGCIEDAISARKEAERRFNYHPNHGRPYDGK